MIVKSSRMFVSSSTVRGVWREIKLCSPDDSVCLEAAENSPPSCENIIRSLIPLLPGDCWLTILSNAVICRKILKSCRRRSAGAAVMPCYCSMWSHRVTVTHIYPSYHHTSLFLCSRWSTQMYYFLVDHSHVKGKSIRWIFLTCYLLFCYSNKKPLKETIY